MKRQISIAAALLLVLLIVGCPTHKEPDETTVETSTPTGCTLSATLSSTLPSAVDVVLSDDYSGLDIPIQKCFDQFSWQEFVALNWPADSNGNPQSGSIGSDPTAMRVWEHWIEAEAVFNPTTMQLATDKKGLFRISKGHFSSTNTIALNDQFVQATTQPLVDQNRNFVLYEIKLNDVETNYIDTAGLATKAGQDTAAPVNFPAGDTNGNMGAIEIKATWKILVAGVDSFDTYYTREANIHMDGEYTANGQPLDVTETVGLVAMHIIHKTEVFPAWIWSTFQHKQNAPGAGTGDVGPWAFNDTSCVDSICPVNGPPDTPYVWQAQKPYASQYAHGTQVAQTLAIPGYTQSINTDWHTALGTNSLWSNYDLVGSQWQAISMSYPPDTTNVPDTLANAVIETYFQNSSCIGSCHTFAKDAAGNNADFSFVLKNAQ